MKAVSIFIITVICLLSGCRSEEIKDKSVSKVKEEPKRIKKTLDSLNVSILLDLSDRIGYSNQKESDLKHVLHIAEIFQNHVLHKPSNRLEDHVQVFFEPDPHPGNTDTVAAQLKFDITRNSTKETMISIEKKYREFTPQLYEWAKESSDSKEGADIWRFFKDNVRDYCIEENHRNILIILTDGYLYHKGNTLEKGKRTTRINQKLLNSSVLNKNDWKTTIEKNNMGILWEEGELKNLEVLVLGIDKHDHKNPYAEDIIKYYWSKWFIEMGVEKYKIKSSDTPIYLKKVIHDFILNK